MIRKFSTGSMSKKAHIALLKNLLLICNLAALVLYLTMHIIFFDFPLALPEETVIVVNITAIASIFAAAISLLLFLTDMADKIYRQKSGMRIPLYAKAIPIAAIVLVVFLNACNNAATTETKKDTATQRVVTPAASTATAAPAVAEGTRTEASTGMHTVYTGLEPYHIYLLMNGEKLNHTDIPIGEKFTLAVEGVKGLVEKDGKVSVGCSLLVSDAGGRILIDEKDQYAGRDEMTLQQAKTLTCTIQTSEAMEWEKRYTVLVKFWDKNGSGKIETRVIFRAIDMP